VEALADMTPEQLEAIEGIGPKTVEKISIAVNNYFSSLEGGEQVAPEGTEEALGEAVPALEASEGTTEAEALEPSAEATEGAEEDTAEIEAVADSPEAGEAEPSGNHAEHVPDAVEEEKN
jgi:N utilization substance protein A